MPLPTEPMVSRRFSLARQFAGATAGLAAMAVLLIALGSWWWIDQLQHDSAQALQQRDVEQRATEVADTVARLLARAHELATNPLVSTALTDSAGRDAYLRPFFGGVQSIDGIPVEVLLVDFEGKEMARSGDLSFSEAQRLALRAALASGQDLVQISQDAGAAWLLVAAPVRYSRTRTTEGAIWLKLPLPGLLRAEGYRLIVGQAPAAGDRLSAKVPLPAAWAPLGISVDRALAPTPHLHAWRYTAGLLLSTLLLVAAVSLVGRHLARGLTADLAALDRFANAVTESASAQERAPVQGSLEVAGLAASINRMLERLQHQHAALQSEARSQLHLLATCIAHLNDMVMITESDPEGALGGHRIVFVNEAFTRVTGYTSAEVLGRSPKLLQGPDSDPAELRRIGDSLRRWEPVRAEVLNYGKQGQRFWIEMEIVPVKDPAGEVTHWVSVERDVTARREAEATRRSLEQQVRESQKMEAIGTLAGGIAHDFNNILGAILGNVVLAREDLVRGQPVSARLEQIGRSAGRARSLVQQILTYSRRQQLQRAPQDLRALVEETTALLRATISARVALHSVLPTQEVIVDGDATELTQVLVNLGTNAWQALGNSSGEVELGLAVVEGLAVPRDASLAEGAARHAHVWVRDSGCGMDAATQARIFEPFFTTKPVGVGTGLGLSVVQGIVRSHGGTIALESEPGKGTTFHVRLPLTAKANADVSREVSDSRVMTPPLGRGERVLYLDDDDVMLTVGSALLERWGYCVTAVRDAASAMTVIGESADGFDLVITDFNMPGLSGIEVLRRLRKLQPMLPVILTSGFISEEMHLEALSAGASGVVRKENLQDDLAAVVALTLRDTAAG